jgi:hypothetical protein
MPVGPKPKALNSQRLLKTSQLRSLFSSGNVIGQRTTSVNALGPPLLVLSCVCGWSDGSFSPAFPYAAIIAGLNPPLGVVSIYRSKSVVEESQGRLMYS